MKGICNGIHTKTTKAEMKFRRGDKVKFLGKDSKFYGYFISYIDKLPINYNVNDIGAHSGKRCVVQQKETGILLIKGEPKQENKGWQP